MALLYCPLPAGKRLTDEDIEVSKKKLGCMCPNSGFKNIHAYDLQYIMINQLFSLNISGTSMEMEKQEFAEATWLLNSLANHGWPLPLTTFFQEKR